MRLRVSTSHPCCCCFCSGIPLSSNQDRTARQVETAGALLPLHRGAETAFVREAHTPGAGAGSLLTRMCLGMGMLCSCSQREQAPQRNRLKSLECIVPSHHTQRQAMSEDIRGNAGGCEH